MILDWLRKSQGWFTRAVLVLLAITFIFGFGFGLVNFGSGRNVPQGTAAEVNGEKIPVVEFYRARDNLHSQYRQGGEIPEGISSYIDQIALNQLIEIKLLSQKAKELGFGVTDKELGESIRSIPALQVDGQFIGTDAYRAFVQEALNESVGEFEKKYREELLAQKLINFIYETAKVTDEELLNLYRMENEKINLYFVSFSPQGFMKSHSPSEEEVKNYYESDKDEFKTPELRSIRYITLGPENFENKVNVSEDEIKARYEANADEFKTQEGTARPLSEVKDEIRADIKRQQGAFMRNEFTQGLEELLKTKSLSQIAEENGSGKVEESGSFSSAEESNEIPPQVVNKAFSLAQGGKSFVRVGDSVWIMEVANITPPRQQELKEAEDKIREQLKFVKAREVAKQKAEETLEKAKKSAGGLEGAAKSLGLELKESGYFSRVEGVPQIGSDELKIDAFYLNNKNPTASKVYNVGDEFYVVSLKEKEEINPEEFREEKAELKETQLSQRKRMLYLDWVYKLRQESEIDINQNLFPPQA